MTGYGHELLFGVALTPDATDARIATHGNNLTELRTLAVTKQNAVDWLMGKRISFTTSARTWFYGPHPNSAGHARRRYRCPPRPT